MLNNNPYNKKKKKFYDGHFIVKEVFIIKFVIICTLTNKKNH